MDIITTNIMSTDLQRVGTWDELSPFLHAARTQQTCAALKNLAYRLATGTIADDAYRREKTRLKTGGLPVAYYQCRYRTTASRAARYHDDKEPTGLAMTDIDGLDDWHTFYEAHIRPILGKCSVLLVHITPSWRGLRLVYPYFRGCGLNASQRRMAEALGLDYDTDPHIDKKIEDMTHASFLVSPDMILYAEREMLFEDWRFLVREAASPTTSLGSSATDATRLPADTPQSATQAPHPPTQPTAQPATTATQRASTGNTTPEGVPEVIPDDALPLYDGRLSYLDIDRAYWELKGGLPGKGRRDEEIYRYARGLRFTTDADRPLMYTLCRRVARATGFSDAETLTKVDSALRYNRSQSLPRDMQAALRLAETRAAPTGEDTDSGVPTVPFPDRLPELLDLLTSNVDPRYRSVVSNAVFPALGTYLCGVTARYITNDLLDPSAMLHVLVGESSAGKSCITEPLRHIMAESDARDSQAKLVEQRWAERNRLLGGNQDKTPRPKVVRIRAAANSTGPVLVYRLLCAQQQGQRNCMYLEVPEIDRLLSLNQKSSRMDLQLIIAAFDRSEWEQDRLTIDKDSVSGSPLAIININASGTPGKVKDYFRKQLVDGPLNRENFSILRVDPMDDTLPHNGTYTPAFDEQLRPYIDRLKTAHGTVCCPEADALALRLHAELTDYFHEMYSVPYKNFAKRALVIAWRKAYLLAIASGGKWTAEMETFIRWSLLDDLEAKMELFGDAVELAMRKDSLPARPCGGRYSRIDLLPQVFGVEDIRRVIRVDDLKSTPSELAASWVRREKARIVIPGIKWEKRPCLMDSTNENTATPNYNTATPHTSQQTLNSK